MVSKLLNKKQYKVHQKQMVSKLLNKKQHKVHHTIKQTINTPPQLKADIVLNVQTNVCVNQRQVLK